MTRLPRLALALVLLAMPAESNAQVTPKDGDTAAPATGAEAGAPPCPVVSGMIRFCGSSPDFVLTPQAENDEVTSYYQTPEGIQAVIIAEPIGTADGLTVPRMQEIALQILSQASGTPVDQIPVLERSTVTIAGMPSANFVYSGTVDGQIYVYSNSVVLQPNSVAQLVTIDLGVTTYAPRHRDLHTRFLSQVQVAP